MSAIFARHVKRYFLVNLHCRKYSNHWKILLWMRVRNGVVSMLLNWPQQHSNDRVVERLEKSASATITKHADRHFSVNFHYKKCLKQLQDTFVIEKKTSALLMLLNWSQQGSSSCNGEKLENDEVKLEKDPNKIYLQITENRGDISRNVRAGVTFRGMSPHYSMICGTKFFIYSLRQWICRGSPYLDVFKVNLKT